MLIPNNHNKRRKQSMKKTFLVIFVGLALAFMAGPLQAANSNPDDVPGTNPLLPFFLVDVAGFASNAGLDTLVVLQEIAGGGTQGKTKGIIHVVIRDKRSNEVGDTDFPYTPNDVLAFSVRDLLRNYVGGNQLPGLELTLNGVDYYVGYVDFENSLMTADNFVAYMYLVNLANGWAAATTIPAQEDASDPGYSSWQKTTYTSAVYGAYTLEPYSAYGYATSYYREKNNNIPNVPPSTFDLVPRFFLKDKNADTIIPIWSSYNHAGPPAYSYPVITFFYDNDENRLSVPVNLPHEVNFIDVRDELPTSGPWADVTGGWIDIPVHVSTCGWLSYSYQTASTPSASLNWSVLTAAHRVISTAWNDEAD
jgi:hypothetical protein